MDEISRPSGSLVDLANSPILRGSAQSHAAWVCLSCTIWYTGGSPSLITDTRELLERTFLSSGNRGVATLIKGWSNATRSILALEPYDTSAVGYCKQPRNCRFALRSAGMTEVDINRIIVRLDGICGIPPFLLRDPYVRVLLGDCDKSVYDAVVPLSNIGRISPQADELKCLESELAFYASTSVVPRFEFDFTNVASEYGMICGSRVSPPFHSRIETSKHSSFAFPRSLGGKEAEIRTEVYDSYLLQTIEDLVPTRPNSDLFDLLGNLVLRREDWQVGTPIADVLYPTLNTGSFCDQRFGLFVLDWAIRKLSDFGTVDTDAPFTTFGYFKPRIRFSGRLLSRVTALSEEGFKARVITITELCVAIIQIVLRHFLDPYVRADPLVKIGLLSGVKLYDLMVELSGGDRRGIDSFSNPSFFARSALSADLTTATDTPPRFSVSTILGGFTRSLGLTHIQSLLELAMDVGLSEREFISRNKPNGHVHRCGIMMGEALSGAYLNIMSGLVRALLPLFMDEFSFYQGSSVRDADDFIAHHHEWIQDFLDSTQLFEFGQDSSQSGDDVIMFNWSEPALYKRFLILLYRVFGLSPSESTFYSSEYYATFTEEAAVRTSQSLGWTFIDCPKPRLFRPIDPNGPESILSRIKQIGNTCRYLRDQAQIERICDCVDLMIASSPMISERIERYNIVPGFPPEFAGLGHPSRYLDGSWLDIPLEDRRLVVAIASCSDEQLFEFKYAWVGEDLEDEEAQDLRLTLRYVYDVFTSLQEGSMEDDEFVDLHWYPEDKLLDRRNFPGAAAYFRELESTKKALGLMSLDDLIIKISSGVRFLSNLDGSPLPELNPLVKLRNRREFLLSRTAEIEADPHVFTWDHVSSAHWRMNQTFRGRCVLMDSFLEVVGLSNLPSLSIPVSLSWGGVDPGD